MKDKWEIHGVKNREEIVGLINFSKAFDYEHDNDREIVIVGCAYIESLAKNLLQESLIQDKTEVNYLLDDGRGALPGVVQRARLLYLMGAFPKVIFEDIKLVAKVRNHFAHNVSASFDDENVVKNVRKMKWHIESMFMQPPENATTRDVYQVAVNQLVVYLNALPRMARYVRNQSAAKQ